MRVNVFSLVAAHAARQADAVALVAPGRPPATYLQVVRHVRGAASQLSARIGRADRIAVVLPNGPEMATAFLAVAAVTACAPLNPGFREQEFEAALADLRPRAGPEITIVDERNRFLGPGEVGEIVVRGESVTSGYADDDAANATAFVGGWFRTGDQGYLDHDGYLFLIGRLKELINRGGEKIAPGEIDETFMEHPLIARAVTFALPDPRLGEEIALAVVPRLGSEITASELLAWAAPRLADFKLPRRVVVVAELPVGATGKVERARLAERLGLTAISEAAVGAAGSRTSPRTESERLVAELFADVLRVGPVSVEDDFFRLGGDSLLAVELSAAVEDRLGVTVPIFVLFERATVESVAAYLDACRRGARGTAIASPHIVRRGAGPEVPLSSTQELLWVQDQLLRGTALNHRPAALEITGPLEHGRLRQAIRAVVARHEVLRTTYRAVRGRPVGIVQPVGDVPFDVDDLSNTPFPLQGQRLAERQALLLREPLDLATGPLLRCRLVRLSDRRHVMLLTVHHIAFDAWSFSVLAGDLAALYGRGDRDPARLPLAELPLQYADYAAWQREALSDPAMREQMDYWRDRLAGKPREWTLDGVALVNHRRGAPGADWRIPVAAELHRRLLSVSARHGGTLYVTLLSAFLALVARSSGESDIVIGTMTSGRGARSTHGLVGVFMNELTIRADLSRAPSPLGVLERARAAVASAFARQDLPFAEVVRTLRSPRGFQRHPIFDIVFQLRNVPDVAASANDVRFQELPLDWGLARFPLMVEVLPRGAELEIKVEFARDLFDDERIARFGRQYLRILEDLAEASSRSTPV